MIHNERIKLLANLLNTMAGSSFAIGVAAPAAASFFYAGPAVGLSFAAIMVGAIAWLFIATVLHLVASWLLGGLRP